MDNRLKKWYTNGIIEAKYFETESIPEGFYPGRLKKISTTKRIYHSPFKGSHWYNNGKIQKLFLDSDEIPPDFTRGTLPEFKEHLLEISTNNKGTKFTEERRLALSNSKKEYYKTHEHYFLGKKHSEETKLKISKANSGKASPNKGVQFTDEQKILRDQKIIAKYGSLENFYAISTENNKQAKLKNHGDSTYNNREKAQATINLDPNFYSKRYEKTKDTKIKKWGSLENATKNRQLTIAQKYGFNNLEDYYKYWRLNILKNVNNKENKFEKRVKTFLESNKILFKSHYLCKDDNLQISHEFDFALFIDNKLEMLIDCDGLYYHGYLSDLNGKSVNNYSDDYRQLLVPAGVKFITIIEGNEEAGFSDIFNLFNIDYNSYLDEIFNWCRSFDFPYPYQSDKILNNSFKSLLQSDPNKFSMKARYGEKIINHFHPSIFAANKQNKLSPVQAWNDDRCLKNCIQNRIIYKGCDLDPSRVLAGLSISGIAPKVSIFNPYLAKYLIYKYLNNYNTIFDPFSGYSGRLLGAIATNKEYIGQDISNITVEESNNLINYFNLNAKVNVADSLITTGSYDCLFTCSPYNLLETWGQPIVNKSCDEWIDICLKNFKCNTYLFVVNNTEKYKDYIVEELLNKSHFQQNVEYVIKIDSTEDN